MPTTGKIQTIADYFGIGKSQLLDEVPTSELHLTKLEEEIIKKFRVSPHKDAILSLLGIEKSI